MGRGMLFNMVKKLNVETVAIHDVNDHNIKMFLDSLSIAEQAKIRVCGSPADVNHYYSRLLSLSAKRSTILSSYLSLSYIMSVNLSICESSFPFAIFSILMTVR